MPNKNKELLDDFIKYCTDHPEQRLWQALRNWSGIPYLWADDGTGKLQDTFYWTGKNEIK